ncbi:hypothetical protein Acr_26g0004110 [Actinidia rufa]|uniref:Uncharacterized protein n=1 Tax=Actinidia rufa TaxID=165716 RepID=A0A7J0H2B9_9ERIC|nr:hypothetical protein Acr_26g0004110 [Actinidia rufa]
MVTTLECSHPKGPVQSSDIPKAASSYVHNITLIIPCTPCPSQHSEGPEQSSSIPKVAPASVYNITQALILRASFSYGDSKHEKPPSDAKIAAFKNF